MSRKNICKVILFLAFMLVIPQIVPATGIEVAVGVWQQDPSGDIGYKGEALNVGTDLKYDSETKFFGRAKIDMPLVIPNIYIMATPMKFEGTGTKNVSFTFGGKTFNGNVPFSSSLQLDHYDIALFYGIPFIKTATLGKFNAELGINARIIDFKAEISQSTTGLSESKSLTVPVPLLYIGAQLKPIKLIGIEAEARGIAYGTNHYYDFIGRLKVRPMGPIFISGGYRYEDIKIDKSDVNANLKFQGPFVEAGVEF